MAITLHPLYHLHNPAAAHFCLDLEHEFSLLGLAGRPLAKPNPGCSQEKCRLSTQTPPSLNKSSLDCNRKMRKFGFFPHLQHLKNGTLGVQNKNIAKGTTDPRVEFGLPKYLILVISQGQTQNFIKFHLPNIDQAPTSKSRHQQTSASRLNLKFNLLSKSSFRSVTNIQLR